MNKHFEAISSKLYDYVTCASHLHLRGIRDVGVKMVEVMRLSLADGYGFEDFKKDADAVAGMPMPDDSVAKFLKSSFEEAARKNEVERCETV